MQEHISPAVHPLRGSLLFSQQEFGELRRQSVISDQTDQSLTSWGNWELPKMATEENVIYFFIMSYDAMWGNLSLCYPHLLRRMVEVLGTHRGQWL